MSERQKGQTVETEKKSRTTSNDEEKNNNLELTLYIELHDLVSWPDTICRSACIFPRILSGDGVKGKSEAFS